LAHIETTTDAVEEFFADFANCEVSDWGDGDLLEIHRGTFQRFTTEICEMNDGEHYVMRIEAHSDDELMSSDRYYPDSSERGGETYYRFETKEGALEALRRFQFAVL
jgi:hypothetical protein